MRAARLISLLTAASFVAACFPHPDASSEAASRPAHDEDPESGLYPVVSIVQPPPRSVLEVPPEEMLEASREGYRPPPDRRFLIAVAQVDHLISGKPLGEVVATWRDGYWDLTYRGQPVGELPEVPDLRDATSVLETFARRSADDVPRLGPTDSKSAGKLAEARRFLDEFDVANAAEAVRLVDGMWRDGARSSEATVVAVRGLSALYLQSYDRLTLGDPLPAKVLAALAVTRALTDAPLLAEEALLADGMGYTAHADSLAALLPPDDPIGRYLRHDDEALRRAAEEPNATHLVRYLYTLRLASRRDPQALYDWTAQYGLEPRVFGLAQLKPWFLTRTNAADASFAGLGPYVALYDMWKTVLPHEALREIPDAKISALSDANLQIAGLAIRAGAGVPMNLMARRFEEDVSVLDLRYHGPFLDAGTYRAYFSAQFYGSIWKLAREVLDGTGDTHLATDLSQSLEDSPPGAASALARWYQHLTDASTGEPFAGDLLADLVETGLLGRVALDRTYAAAKKLVPSGDPRRTTAAQTFVRHLDTRADNLATIANLLESDLHDVELSRRLFLRAHQVTGMPALSSMLLLFEQRDLAGLEKQIRNAASNPVDRLWGWRLLNSTDPQPPLGKMVTLARGILDDDPDTWWRLRADYVEALVRRKAYREELRTADEWLATHGPDAGMDYVMATTARAGALYRLGRFAEALEAVQPVAATNQAGAVARAALSMERLGRHEEALRLMRGVVRDYPQQAWARADLAEILWRQDRADEVPSVLNDRGYPLSADDWVDWAGPAFAAAFDGRPREEASQAIAALVDGGVAWLNLEGLGIGAVTAGGLEAAFAVYSSVPPNRRLISTYRLPIEGYKALKEIDGEKKALAWLEGRIPPELQTAVAMDFYELREYDLLWTLMSDPTDTDPNASFAWLMRAAAQAGLGEAAHPDRWARLRAHYEASDLADDYDAMGAYLVGLVDLDRLLPLATTQDRRCEISYYVAVRAEADGHRDVAAAWYRVAELTQSTPDGEWNWARSWIQDQLDAGASAGGT